MEDHQVGKTVNKKKPCLQGYTPTGQTSEHQMKPEEILSLLLLLGLILLFFIILFNFIVSNLKLPESGTRPPEFKVDQVVVFQFNIRSSHLDTLSVVTSSHLDSKSIVTFSVKNPNSYRRENIYCEDVMASVLYKDVNISSVRIEPFFYLSRSKDFGTGNYGPHLDVYPGLQYCRRHCGRFVKWCCEFHCHS